MPDTKHALFVRTYHKDAERLHYCLASIMRFCEGFSETVVVCPPSSAEVISRVVANFPGVIHKITREYERDYLGQQRDKLRAYEFTNADYIHHVDSDCVFNKKYEPHSLFRGSMPLLYHREYDFFYRNRMLTPWQLFTSRAALRQVDLEFMAMLPLIYPRELCLMLNLWLDENHGGVDALLDKAASQYEFSEFNLLGAASYYKFCVSMDFHAHVNWGQEEPERFLKQFCLSSGHLDRSIANDELQELQEITGTKLDAAILS